MATSDPRTARRVINVWIDGITVTTLWPSLSICLTVTKKAGRG